MGHDTCLLWKLPEVADLSGRERRRGSGRPIGWRWWVPSLSVRERTTGLRRLRRMFRMGVRGRNVRHARRGATGCSKFSRVEGDRVSVATSDGGWGLVCGAGIGGSRIELAGLRRVLETRYTVFSGRKCRHRRPLQASPGRFARSAVAQTVELAGANAPRTPVGRFGITPAGPSSSAASSRHGSIAAHRGRRWWQR